MNYRGNPSHLVHRLGEILRKMWNPRQYRGQVSPHELMVAVAKTSQGRFVAQRAADPAEFLTWLLNQIHVDLTGGKRKKKSVVSEAFQGEMEVVTEAGTGAARGHTENLVQVRERGPGHHCRDGKRRIQNFYSSTRAWSNERVERGMADREWYLVIIPTCSIARDATTLVTMMMMMMIHLSYLLYVYVLVYGAYP